MDSDGDDPAVNHYNDGNRAFVQALMARGTLTSKEAKPILAAIFTVQEGKETLPEDVTEEDFSSYISAASHALSPFDYEIRSTIHQVSKERIYAIVNSTSDPMTQVATIRTADEIAFIKRVLDAMFETYNTPRQEIMGVTSMQAMKCARGDGRNRQSLNAGADGEEATQVVDKGLTGSQAERLMNSLVAEGWFERSKEGWFTLSARALMELKAWLVATYNDPDAEDGDWQRIKSCAACKSIVTIGQRCPNLDCNMRLHDVCQAAFWRTRKDKRCPKCKTEWNGNFWVGERAVTTGEAYMRGKRRSGGQRRGDVNGQASTQHVGEAEE